jgi:SHS2 domain-containing protein
VKDYELLEHTADIKISVTAVDLKELFKNSASAMFDIMAEEKLKARKPKILKIKQKAGDLEELFINWLNELLSLSATKGLIFEDFKIAKLNEKALEATASGSDIKNYKVNTEIKAATYHGLKLERDKFGWQVEVILDV